MKKTKIALAVVNDLNYDQRMHKICSSLYRAGFHPVLIGRTMNHSKTIKVKPFEQKRFNILFQKGKMFYVLYNIKLFLHYFFSEYDILVANDLDTLPATFFAAKLKGIPYVYDAHEYFPQLPEVVNRPFTRKVWEFVESVMVPQTDYLYTINTEYARIFKKKYNKEFNIVRNISVLEERNLAIETDGFILYQGAVNVGRGVEEMIEAMQFIDSNLVICGMGDRLAFCKELCKKLNLEDKVEFKGFVDPEELREITIRARLGFTFFTDEGESYYYSLANRFFDYMHNGVPQLCINFPEYKKINDEFNFALMLDDLKIETIVQAANSILNDEDLYNELRNNCFNARKELNWQNEEQTLLSVYHRIIEDLK